MEARTPGAAERAACNIPVMADVGLDALEAELAPVTWPSWSFRQLLD